MRNFKYMDTNVSKIVEFINQTNNFKLEELQNSEYPDYVSLPLCVIDSIFSIGVKYNSVKNTVQHFCEYVKKEIGKNPLEEEISVSEILILLDGKNEDFLANETYNNRQRTSTRNGMLKVLAVTQFLQVLKTFGIENLIDVPKISNNVEFDTEVKKIKGQSSGISLSYFFMLAGDNNRIKADRMVMRFLKDRTGKNSNPEECQELLEKAAEELRVTPKELDFSIWKYESEKSRKTIEKQPYQ
ncbi:hypothetical protein FACS18945_0180 [Bacteroidia bacterium]|nr:hypothetical protein FACS18945_0180 [Bacteroidia bacterium]